VKAEHN